MLVFHTLSLARVAFGSGFDSRLSLTDGRQVEYSGLLNLRRGSFGAIAIIAIIVACTENRPKV